MVGNLISVIAITSLLNIFSFMFSRISKNLKTSSAIIRLAELLSIYSGIHGDMLVPTSFVVPSNSDDWPT